MASSLSRRSRTSNVGSTAPASAWGLPEDSTVAQLLVLWQARVGLERLDYYTYGLRGSIHAYPWTRMRSLHIHYM